MPNNLQTPDRGLRGRGLVRCIRVVQTPKRVVEGVLCIIIILGEQLLELDEDLRGASRSLDAVRNDPRPRLMDTSRVDGVKASLHDGTPRYAPLAHLFDDVVHDAVRDLVDPEAS